MKKEKDTDVRTKKKIYLNTIEAQTTLNKKRVRCFLKLAQKTFIFILSTYIIIILTHRNVEN